MRIYRIRRPDENRISPPLLMNPSDRRSFDSFCNALQYFPIRLAERPCSPLAGVTSDFIPYNRQGNTLINKRQENFWSIVHVGVHGPFPRSRKMSGNGFPAPFQKMIIHRFQLRYADIPIEPIIEVLEPYPDLQSESIDPKASQKNKMFDDVQWFNSRVADAARAVLGHRRHSWPRTSSSWLQNLYLT